MANLIGTKGYLTVGYLFTCTHCGTELVLQLQENKTKAIKAARSKGWSCCYAGYVCPQPRCKMHANNKSKQMKAEGIPNYMLALAE